jgi:hypothetical protein
MAKEIETLDDFYDACAGHDLTYSYSDDSAVWRHGSANEDRIRKAAEKFPREDVERIWNGIVDKKMREGYREQFYWRWPR